MHWCVIIKNVLSIAAVSSDENLMFIPFRGCIRNLMLFRSGEIMRDLISRSVEQVNVDLTGCTV